MTHGSLFSGIGGFDLAAEWMGWENVFHCEWNEFGQKILNHYWPNAKSYGDITKTDFSIWRGRIDILTGGFPCQPYSVAGKRKGKEDERHLWPEMLRAIREIHPRYIVGENVPGLINWNGGMVFDEVQTDLETEGYKVIPFILPACSVNAPHKRERVWFIANNSRLTGESEIAKWEERGQEWEQIRNNDNANGEGRIVANTNSNGLERGMQENQPSVARRLIKKLYTQIQQDRFKDFPSQSPVCGRDDEFSYRLDGITFPKWRNESIKAYGNAIVPQVAFQIFKAVEEFNNNLSLLDLP